tara:strand:+ start:43 stop:252 length:210 start_codon:yes stop_codon:yes gene_type:complete
MKDLLKALQEQGNMELLNILLFLINDEIENEFAENIKKLKESEIIILAKSLYIAGHTEDSTKKILKNLK